MTPEFSKFNSPETAMDKKSKLLLVILILSILTSIFFTYKRAFIDQNFTIIEEEAEEETAIEEITEETL